jgi:two-component system nitrogen regulation sensor histidine kinase NtrY
VAEGLVLTFDDITRLVAAQRNAAWKDVARRIAHEIKNPLTPIQLSAERLRRKYRKEITSDLETFDRCTETIIRQVGDIGRMVDEFSAFARMPAPRFEPADLTEMLRQAVFAQRFVDAEIEVSWKSRRRGRLGHLRRADDRPGPDQHPQERRRGGRRAPPERPNRRITAIVASLVADDELCVTSRTTAWACPPRTATA